MPGRAAMRARFEPMRALATAPDRLARVQSLAVDLAAEVRAIYEAQTLAQHIRDRAAWTGLEMDARRLRVRGDRGDSRARAKPGAGFV